MPDNMLDNKSLDLLFREARSQNAYADVPISDDTLKALYDIWKYGPTSANCSPARVVFVRSEEGKAKLLPHLMGGNQEKTKSAAVLLKMTIILKELSIAQLCFEKGTGKCLNETNLYNALALLLVLIFCNVYNNV